MITKDELKAVLKHRRPEVTSDDDWGQLTVIKEYEFLPIKDKVVMDVGGNIGAMALRCALEGAASVHTYEPHPGNYETLLKNVAPYPVIKPHNAALVISMNPDPIPLYITNERTLGSCSTTEFRGRSKIMVPCLNFSIEMDEIRPDSIKLDCEGSEWNLLRIDLPPCVRDVVAELHFTKKQWRTDDYPEIMSLMEMQGFKLIREPKETGNNWHTIAHWRR